MKTISFLVMCIIIMHLSAKSQVKIGDNPTSLNSASLLELETTNKGFVLPRVSITNVNSSAPLTAGLLTGTIVYNTNSSTTGGSGTGIYYWDGSAWNFLANTTITGNYWSITGNSGTSPSSNFIGTTDAKDFVARTNNIERMRILGVANGSSQVGWIGMGVAAPKSALDVAGNYAGKNVITIQNTSSTGFSSVDMLDNAGNLATTFGFANTGTGTAFTGKAYLNGYGNDFLFTRGSSYDLIMKGSNGYVGLNTSTPSERLHVVGNFYLSGAFMPGGNAGTSGYFLTSAGANTSPTWTNPNSIAWRLTGNSGTSAATNFIGTSDAVDFVTRTNNTERLRVTSAGNVGIGLTNPSYKLAVLAASNPLYLSGVQATASLSTDSILTINAGIVKKTPYSSLSTATTNTLTLSTNTLTSTVNGIVATSNAVSDVNNISSANTLSTTVNGVTGTGVSIINSNTKTWTQTDGLTTSVNGVSSNITPASGTVSNILGYNASGIPVYQTASDIINGATTNTLNLSGNTLTSTVNGVVAASNAVSGVNNTSSANTLSTTVNGVTGLTVPIINSNTKTWTQSGGLTTTVNGVASNIKPASGTISNMLGYNASGAPVYQSLNNINLSTAWNLLGNSGTNASTNFIGTTDAVDFVARTSNTERLRITSAGNVGIGLTNPSYKLAVLAASNPLYLSGVQATASLNTDSILTINAGVVKKTPYSSLNGDFWNLKGNSGTNYATDFLGTTDNVSMRFRTNNTEQMIIDSVGHVGIGASSFNPLNPAKLLVDYGTTTSNTLANLKGSIDGYLQINVQNKSAGSNSSSDIVATASDGTDSTFYVDLGINGGGYVATEDNWGGPHDAYLYTYGKNLVIGSQSTNGDVLFLLGGGRSKYNAVLRLDGATKNLIVGTGENQSNATGNIIRGPNGGNGTNIPGGSLTLQGGSSNGNTSGGNLNLYGGSTVSGTMGSININTSVNSATNINTGTSSANVTIGNNSNNILLPKFNTNGGMFYTTAATGQIASTGLNMTWNDANNSLGIGISNPAYKLSVLAPANPLYLSGVQATSTFNSDSILTINAGVVKKTPYSSLSGANNWALTGNSGTTAGTNFIGTTDAADFVTKTNNAERMRITSGGLVGIGTNAPVSDLTVFQSAGSGSSKGITFTGNSISGPNSGTGFLMSLGYNSAGNKQLWLGDADYAGNAAGSFARFVSTGTSFPVFDAVSGSGASRRYMAFGVAGDANSGVIFGTDNSNVSPGSQVWDNGNMTIGAGYKSFAAPANGLLVQGNVGIGTTSPSSALHVAGTNPLTLIGVQATLAFTTDSVLTIYNGVVKKTPYSSLPGSVSGWSLTGNSGTIAGTNFLGTTDATALQFKFNNTLAGYLDASNTSFGTSASALNNAVAIGENATATLLNNTAVGNDAKANVSSQATAIGASSQALLQNNVALGYNAQATVSNQETAIGASSQVQGQNNIAIGYSAKALNSDKITVVGSNAQASFQNNTVLGYGALATTNNQATAIGATAVAQAQNATALGYGASATGINSTAIGSGATTSQNNALVLGTSTANVGIRTSTPNTTAALDVNASFKLGDVGTVNKNVVSFASTLGSTSIAAGSAFSFFGIISFSSGSTDITVTIPAAANYLTSTKATVTVSPSFDLPAGVSIASARMISTSQVKIRIVNANTDAQSISGQLYVTINEF